MPLIIAQITDLHICETTAPMEERINPAGFLEQAVRHLNDLQPRPDVVVITGDLVDKCQRSEYDRLRDLLSPLAMPYYLLVGNHDDRDHLRAVFPEHDYLNTGPGGFVQYRVDLEDLHLLCLDTQHRGQPWGEMCQTRLDWLDQQLRETDPGRCLLFMHHPPFRTGLDMMDGMGFRTTDAFMALLKQYEPVLRVQCGHLHRPITKLAAGTLMATCPSSAHQIRLDINQGEQIGISFEPPAVQLHTWFGETDGLVTHQSVIGDYRTIDLTQQFQK